MKLIGMMDSPYVRRVAVSLALYGVEFESLPLSVFSGFDEFSRINPVVKAPTVVLDNGTQLMDSTLILHYFETTNPAGRRLLPVHPEALARDLHLLGVILAACEKAVQHVYEHRLRPEEKQHQPWIARVTGQLLAACREWDARLADRAAAAQPDQGDGHQHGGLVLYPVDDPGGGVGRGVSAYSRAGGERGGAAGVSTVSAGLTAGWRGAPQRGALKQERITSRQTRRRPPGLRRCRTRRRRWRGTAPGRPSLPPSPSAASASGFQTRGSGAPSPDGYSSAWRYIPD